MFSNFESEVVGFDSNWNIERKVSNTECQTEPITVCDQITATNISKHASTQSDTQDESAAPIPSSSDIENLGNWLQKISPLILSELQLHSTSDLFEEYNYDSEDEKSNAKISNLQTIPLDETLNRRSELSTSQKNSTEKTSFTVLGLSWNSVGYTLAMATGHLNHDSWCDHNSYVFLFTKRTDAKDLEYFYDAKISACITSIVFHPKESGLLGIATVSGEISICNFLHLNDGSNRDVFICSNSSSHMGKPVSIILWLNNEQSKKYFSKTLSATEKILVSAGSDGKVIVWNINISSFSMIQIICYEIHTEISKRINLAPDITCIDFYQTFEPCHQLKKSSPTSEREDADDYFVIGCRTGELVLCRSSIAKPLGLINFDPCVENLEPHNACVLSLSFSSKFSRKFITLGADQEIRTYNTSSKSPLEIIHLEDEFSCIKWLPSDASLVIVAASTKSDSFPLQIFNVNTKRKQSIKGLLFQKAYDGNFGLSALDFHNKDTNLFAFGDVSGKVTIMRIPSNLHS